RAHSAAGEATTCRIENGGGSRASQGRCPRSRSGVTARRCATTTITENGGRWATRGRHCTRFQQSAHSDSQFFRLCDGKDEAFGTVLCRHGRDPEGCKSGG